MSDPMYENSQVNIAALGNKFCRSDQQHRFDRNAATGERLNLVTRLCTAALWTVASRKTSLAGDGESVPSANATSSC